MSCFRKFLMSLFRKGFRIVPLRLRGTDLLNQKFSKMLKKNLKDASLVFVSNSLSEDVLIRNKGKKV